jgi:hypothetical protein
LSYSLLHIKEKRKKITKPYFFIGGCRSGSTGHTKKA